MQAWDGFILDTWWSSKDSSQGHLMSMGQSCPRYKKGWFTVSPTRRVSSMLSWGEYQIWSHTVALKLVALGGQDVQSQCRDMVLCSLDTSSLTHCLLSVGNPGTAPTSYTLCKICNLKCLDIWPIPRRYKSLLKARKPWDLFQPQICLTEPRGRQMNCDCRF